MFVATLSKPSLFGDLCVVGNELQTTFFQEKVNCCTRPSILVTLMVINLLKWYLIILVAFRISNEDFHYQFILQQY